MRNTIFAFFAGGPHLGWVLWENAANDCGEGDWLAVASHAPVTRQVLGEASIPAERGTVEPGALDWDIAQAVVSAQLTASDGQR